MAKTIKVRDVSKAIDISQIIEKHKLRLRMAPLQWLLGEILTRIHVRGENSNNEPMTYGSLRYIVKRFNLGLRIDRKNLQFTEDSLLGGLQIVIEEGKPTIQMVGTRNEGGESIDLKDLAAWQENIEILRSGSPIWKPSKFEVEEMVNRFKVELDAILKEEAK